MKKLDKRKEKWIITTIFIGHTICMLMAGFAFGYWRGASKVDEFKNGWVDCINLLIKMTDK